LRILIDESLPISLARELASHEVTTVRAQRWLGLRNGVLLRAAVDAGFEVIITADKALRHQQNLPAIGIAVVLLTRVRNRMQDLQPLIPRIVQALLTIRRGELVEVEGHSHLK
jgi:predicted nuclease of predicted toxin-antitoxin system